MFRISVRIIFTSFIDLVYIIFQTKSIGLVSFSNYIHVAVSCLKNNYYSESCKVHSFIPPLLLGSCMAGLESGLGLKW